MGSGNIVLIHIANNIVSFSQTVLTVLIIWLAYSLRAKSVWNMCFFAVFNFILSKWQIPSRWIPTAVPVKPNLHVEQYLPDITCFGDSTWLCQFHTVMVIVETSVDRYFCRSNLSRWYMVKMMILEWIVLEWSESFLTCETINWSV